MCPTITVGSFFRPERSTFLFICSTTSNLNNFKPQQLQPQKRVQNEKKKQNRRPQPRKHTKDFTLAPFFRHYATSFEVFWIAPEGPPFICFDILQQNGCQKIAKGPPFYIFRHCDTVRKSHLKKLGNFSVSEGSHLHFSSIFCNQLEFHKARRVPLLNFEPYIWRRIWPFSACLMLHWAIMFINNEILAHLTSAMTEINSENLQIVISKIEDENFWNFFKLMFQKLTEKTKKLSNLLTEWRIWRRGCWSRSVIHQRIPFFSHCSNWKKRRSGRRYESVFVWLSEYKRLPWRLQSLSSPGETKRYLSSAYHNQICLLQNEKWGVFSKNFAGWLNKFS